MTFIASFVSKESIWMVADRRLTFPTKINNNARKIMILAAGGDVAIFGYAGLGLTAGRVEPSDWMSGVFRGHKMPLEDLITHFVGVMQQQLPKHLRTIPAHLLALHSILIPSFVDGKSCLYVVQLQLTADRKSYNYVYTKYLTNNKTNEKQHTLHLLLTGSGAQSVVGEKRLIRDIFSLIKAYNSKKISWILVSQKIAELNHLAHLNTADESVGTECIVAWRNNPKGHFRGGGGHKFFANGKRVKVNQPDFGGLPMIDNGLDSRALAQILHKHFWEAAKKSSSFPVIQSDEDIKKAVEEFNRRKTGPKDRLN